MSFADGTIVISPKNTFHTGFLIREVSSFPFYPAKTGPKITVYTVSSRLTGLSALCPRVLFKWGVVLWCLKKFFAGFFKKKSDERGFNPPPPWTVVSLPTYVLTSLLLVYDTKNNIQSFKFSLSICALWPIKIMYTNKLWGGIFTKILLCYVWCIHTVFMA